MRRELLRRVPDRPWLDRAFSRRVLGKALLTFAATSAIDTLVRMTADSGPARLALWLGVFTLALALFGRRGGDRPA